MEEKEKHVLDKDKALKFKKTHGYSITFAKLMRKWNCSTPDEYRKVRKQHKKENYVGPRKEKKTTTK